MARDSVLKSIHDALAHLHELPFLPSHPLATRLGRQDIVSGTELRRVLLEAIERLRPPSEVEPGAPRRRQYHYIRRRYLEGATPLQIQHELTIGDRQARRVRLAALRALAVELGCATQAELSSEGALRDSVSLAAALSLGRTEGVLPGSKLDAELTRVELGSAAEPTDLKEAITSVLDLVRALTARHGVEVSVASEVGVTAVTVRTVLRHLLLNLLTYLISAYPRCTIDVTAHRASAEVALTFRLAAVDSRLDLITRQSVGSEQLSAARRLADGLSGRLETGSGGAGGVLARLVLPAVKPSTVLVVDDNPDVGHVFRRYLQGAGFRIIQARNGPGALELAGAADPQVIILDLMMPVEDGWEVFQELRSHPTTREIPVIACSVLPERELALSLGIDGFLAKPVTRESLLAELRPYQPELPTAHPGSPANS